MEEDDFSFLEKVRILTINLSPWKQKNIENTDEKCKG